MFIKRNEICLFFGGENMYFFALRQILLPWELKSSQELKGKIIWLYLQFCSIFLVSFQYSTKIRIQSSL